MVLLPGFVSDPYIWFEKLGLLQPSLESHGIAVLEALSTAFFVVADTRIAEPVIDNETGFVRQHADVTGFETLYLLA
jgi:hypothetical protein